MTLTVKPGDRVKEDHGEQVVITPPAEPSDYQYNFGPASSRDDVVFTCERPGGDTGNENSMVTALQVSKWMAFMTTKQITHVIILMEDSELTTAYDAPGLIAAYQQVGMGNVHHIPYSAPNAASRILKLLQTISAKNEKAVAHCTHGMGRSGRVAAAWLVQTYKLTPLEAVEEALEAARIANVERMGAPKQLQEWMGNK